MSILQPMSKRESEAGFHVYSRYRECPRAFFLRYVMGFQPTHPGKALIFGGVMHEAVEAYYQSGGKLSVSLDTFQAHLQSRREEYAKAEDYDEDLAIGPMFLREWDATWGSYDKSAYDLVEVETQYNLKLGPNGEFDFTVRPDRVMREKVTKRYVVFDTKTTRWSVQGTFTSVKAQDQMTSYVWAMHTAHPEWTLSTAVPDVIYSRGSKVTAERPGEMYFDAYALHQFEMGMYGSILEISSKVAALDEVPHEVSFPRNGSQCAKFGCDYADVCRVRTDETRIPLGFRRDPWKEEKKS